MMLLQWACNICHLCSTGRKTITLSKTLACNCNSLWHTMYKYLMHVDIEVVLTMPRILYPLSQTCKHPALRFSLAAPLVERRGEKIPDPFWEAFLLLGSGHHSLRAKWEMLISLTFSGLNQARIVHFCPGFYGANIAFQYEIQGFVFIWSSYFLTELISENKINF